MDSRSELDFGGLVAQRIERLRPKLLDLSLRNPLLSSSFNRGPLVRVVDELPEKLFAKLPSGLTFHPLPPLDATPADEQTQAFLDALASARLTDEIYLKALEGLGDDGAASLEANSAIERELRDRVREVLGLPPRPSGPQPSLDAHARLHGLEPSYDLPAPDPNDTNPLHDDKLIQTLLLPDDLQRKLSGISDKARSWLQETGVNVMHMAIGFLEWRPPNATKSAFAPLLLVPVELTKRRTGEGLIFSVKSSDPTLAVNEVLRIKLANDFGVEIPSLQGESIEDFLAELATMNPATVKLTVRRQVAFGIFPSARIAMYHDLAQISTGAGDNAALRRIFAGSEDAAANPFADDYGTDALEIAQEAPPLVLDADGSQVSAVVDALKGENLALEGPPGSGKSQTIVNMIAAAIANGKSVLFVAEKMAALEVVHARLRAIGLDVFLLPLQAARGSKEAVMNALRERLNASTAQSVAQLTEKRRAYAEARDTMARYLAILATDFGNSGLTVHTAIGHAIGAMHRLQTAPALLKLAVPDAERWSKDRRERAGKLADDYAKSRAAASPDSAWRGIGLVPVHSYGLDAKTEEARQLADTVASWADQAHRLGLGGGDIKQVAQAVAQAAATIETLKATGEAVHIETAVGAIRQRSERAIIEFAEHCEHTQTAFRRLAEDLVAPEDDGWPQRIGQVVTLVAALDADTLDVNAIAGAVDEDRAQWASVGPAVESLEIAVTQIPALADRSLDEIAQVRSLATAAGREALALRTDVSLTPAATASLVRAAKQGLELVEKRQLINAAFERMPDPSPEELAGAAAALKSAGFFARFAQPFQKAKALYRSYAKAGKFNRQSASQALFAAADFKRDADAFVSDAATSGAFGVHWRKLDTDFQAFLRLAEFCVGIQRLFSELRDAGLRQTMTAASDELLLGLPETPSDAAKSSVAAFVADARRRQKRVEQADASLPLLAQALDGFIRPTSLSQGDCKKLAELLTSTRQLAAKLDGHREVSAILGPSFAGWRTSVAVLSGLVSIIRVFDASGVRDAVSGAISAFGFAGASDMIVGVSAKPEATLSAIDQLAGEGGAPFATRLRALDLDSLSDQLASAAGDRDGLRAHAECALHLRELGSLGLDLLVPTIADIRHAELALDLDAIIAKSMADAIFKTHGDALGRFAGSRLASIRAEIAELDRQIQTLTRQEVRATALKNCKPPQGNGAGPVGTRTELALLNHLVSLTRPNVAPRDMVARAGRAMKALKPCWMMSPLAVAQYVPTDLIFDLCIIDEASQMTPEDSLGAIARAKQTIIVGDTNQLPPSSFFRTVLAEADDEDTEVEAVVEESILEMANAAFAKKRRLRWHYRSQHTSLIAFSNHHIYDDDLVLFPSADDRRPDRGVSLREVSGLYKKGLNPIEAKAVVEAATQFMHDYPDRSLGIVAMNQKQRDLILEEVEIVAAKDDAVRAYIERWAAEDQGIQEFFVKNLENVQGDERDAIFISTVYGPETHGARVMRRFGPINGKVGRRRLNVLFTRAKQQIITFTSLTPADIGVSPTENAGAFLLKRWLEYSATGVIEAGEGTGRPTDSPFEDFVLEQIRKMGLEAVPQVGVKGYFVDIGVHPRTGRMGSSSASSATAPPTIRRGRRGNGTGCVRRFWSVLGGGSTGFGRPIGSPIRPLKLSASGKRSRPG